MSQTHIKLKTGDTVKVRRGKDSGKTGKISQVLPRLGMVVVDGVNKTIRHLRSTQRGQQGQRVEFFAPIPAAVVSLVCPKCNKPTRIGAHLSKGENGEVHKSRHCKKCKETF